MKFMMKNPVLSLGALTLVLVGIVLLVSMQFQQAPVQVEAKQQSLAQNAEPTVNEKQPDPPARPVNESAHRQSTETPAITNGDAGEPVYEAIPGADSIAMLNGPELVVIPADPNKPRAEQVEWRYVPVPRLEEAKYDKDKRILICRIDCRLSAQTKDRVYARLRELTGAPSQTAFRLNPVRSQTLSVELVVLDKKVMLRTENSGHDIAYGPIPVLFRVKDDELHEFLSTNLQDMTLTIRTTHPYASVTRQTMQIESSMTAAREAFEKVLPLGMELEDLEKHPLIVDRDSLLQLKQYLREEFRIRVEGSPVQFAGLDRVLERLLDRITVSNLPLHEVTSEMTNSALIWDSKTARLDVAANERTTMTRELKEATEKRTAFKHAWDTMREEAKKAKDHKTWHKTLLEKVKKDGKLNLGIGIFTANGSFSFENEHNESDQGTDKVLRETFEKMKNAGEMTEETFEKSYREFKGEDWAKSASGKIINLQRVTNFNVQSFRSALLERVERLSKGMLERVTYLPLQSSNSQYADLLREIQLLTNKHEDLSKAFVERTNRLKADMNQLIPQGLAVPFFGEKIPTGWEIVNDQNRWKITATYLPKHLRGQTMPNLVDAPLIGTNSVEDVGKDVKVTQLTASGNVDANGLKVTLEGKDGWAINSGRGERSWLWVPGGQPLERAVVVADAGGKIDDAWLHRFHEPTKEQSVKGQATATVTADLTRGNIPGVRIRWIVFVGAPEVNRR